MDAADMLNNGEVCPNIRECHAKNTHHLNQKQCTACEILKDHIDQSLGGLHNVYAPGGTGKTFLCNIILACVRKENNAAIATAISGIATILMSLGSKAHKRFSFPTPPCEYSTYNINFQIEKANIIKNSKIMFIDEYYVMLYKLFDCLDHFLQELMNYSLPISRKLVVFMGDFHQILPVF